ncbi:MAG: DUF4118 domain-containing protein [Lachnospiraceae bacterium]|nr:DUF4118 domain-containing protein [Lachnospiraceae bacterium]MDD7025379.1 DUF4118 domain-containing protein [Oscillospiraceae bacterium]MDY5540354.1 DUF4118 domain-containing protein [Lachnospiraceae bacterium]
MNKLHISDLFKTVFMLTLAYKVSDILLNYTGIENNSALVFVLAVLVISKITEGYLWGIVASIVSAFCINYYFMYPYARFNVTVAGYPIAIISMLIVSIVTGTMTSRIKQQAQEALRREQQTRELYQMNRQLNDERTAIKIEAEKEKMRSNLLRAISHDLRTPLTTIIGSTTLILEGGANMEEEEVQRLLMDIREDSEWLLGMVENLLSITRFRPGETKLKTQPEIMEDVISDAVIKTKKRFPDCNIQVSLPTDILMAPMDSMLIKQVIINLLENALRHSGDKEHIQIDSYQKDSYAVVEVSDRGKGLNTALEESPSSDSSKGHGIGLPVCESIIKAHNGFFESENRPGGGATFRFGLPIQEVEQDD